MLKALSAFSFISLISSFACATPVILCLRAAPQFTEIMDGQISSTQAGPAALINADKNQITWVGTGGYIHVDAKTIGGEVRVVKVTGSNPGAERILSSEKNSMVLESLPPIYQTTYRLKIQDSLGGVADLVATMRGATMGDQSQGSARWTLGSDSVEKLAYCTTKIEN